MKKKEILAAGYIRDIRFSTVEDMELYLYELRHREQLYTILETYTKPNGSVIIRIVQKNSQRPLKELYGY